MINGGENGHLPSLVLGGRTCLALFLSSSFFQNLFGPRIPDAFFVLRTERRPRRPGWGPNASAVEAVELLAGAFVATACERFPV